MSLAAAGFAFSSAASERLSLKDYFVFYFVVDGGSEDEAQSIGTRIRDQHTGVAVEVVEGGQPHYPYVVSLE